MEESSFLVGALCGIAFAGIIGYLFAQISKQRTMAGAMHRPMGIPTAKTPDDVQKSSREAGLKVIGFVLLAILAGIVGLGIIFYAVSVGI